MYIYEYIQIYVCVHMYIYLDLEKKYFGLRKNFIIKRIPKRSMLTLTHLTDLIKTCMSQNSKYQPKTALCA